MKIAHVVSSAESVPPQSKNGLEFIAAWLVEGLVERGHEVTLFAPADSAASKIVKPLVARGVSKQDIPEFEKSLIQISTWNTLYAGTLAKDFEIMHFHNPAAYIAPFTDTPLVQTLHHPYTKEFLGPYLERPDNHSHMRFIFDQYQKVHYVTISNRQQQIFRKSAEAYYFKKYHTIYNGIPVEQFTFNETPQDYLFFIGYLNKDKGVDTAVQVARALNKKLVIAGENLGQEEFFAKQVAPYLNDDIQYIGPVDFEQKNELYRNAYATLAPILWEEPFGLTLVESQACGTPVITFNRGASPEIVKHGETGFVVNTLEEMTAAVENVKTISRQNCRTWVEHNFSMEKMIDEYEKYYADILSKTLK